jgi:hypothetical protein
MRLRGVLLASALCLAAGSEASAQSSCAQSNYKALSQILSEFQTCVAQGFGPGCITVSNFQDLICSARKLAVGDFSTVSPSGAIYTPDFNTGVNFSITLAHATCPCTLANPVNFQNQSGVLEIIQSSSGSDLISTYGSIYLPSTVPTLSTGASAKDYVPYAVNPAGKIVFGAVVLNAH